MRPILGGRDEARLAALASELGLEYRVARLDAGLDEALREVGGRAPCRGAVLHDVPPDGRGLPAHGDPLPRSQRRGPGHRGRVPA